MYFRRKTLPHADFFQDAPIAVLRELLAACMNGLEKENHVYCIVDALDEANEEEVLEMVEFLQHVDNGSRQLSVCFASRHYPTLDLPIPAQIVIDHDSGHTHDLEHYIEVKLQAKNVGELKPVILRKANGIFMWVVLVITILNREARHGSITTVRKRLDSLPSELIKLVKSISQQGDIPNDHFILCLQWILCAQRPLTLPEFYFAMMSGMDEDASLIWYRDQIDEVDMVLFLITYSKGMAELSRGDVPTVQFIHESIRDFLLQENGMNTLSEDGRQAPIPAAHDRLAHCCWRAFDFGNFNECWAIKNRDRVPLFYYALAHVMTHCEFSQNALIQTSFVSQFNFHDWQSWAKGMSGNLMTSKDFEDALTRADCYTLLELYRETPHYTATGAYHAQQLMFSLAGKYHLASDTTLLEIVQIENMRQFLNVWETDLKMSEFSRVLSLVKTMQVSLSLWYDEHKKEVRPRITSIHNHETLVQNGSRKEAYYTHIFVIINALDHAYLQLLRNLYGLLHADGIICMMFQKLDTDRSQDGQWFHDLESTRAIVRWWSRAADTCDPLMENEQIELHGSRVFTQGYRSPIIMLAR